MPSQLTYPGVYIEEIPSGVRTIAGVSTSTGCFVGWAPKGSDRPVRVFSFSEYERRFGGLHAQSELGYSVKHFFDNGGSETYILRLTREESLAGVVELDDLVIKASSAGNWSDFYGVQTKASAEEGRFSLTVFEFAKKADGSVDTENAIPVEQFFNLSMVPNDPRFVREIVNDIERGSLYIEIDQPDTGATGFGASDDITPFEGGADVPFEGPNSRPFIDQLEKANGEDKLLDTIDLFNLLCVPGLTDVPMLEKLHEFATYRRAFLIVDCEEGAQLGNVNEPPIKGKNGAFYFPQIKAPDPLAEGRIQEFPPCGFIAGIYARTDATRGVWKAPAGIDAALRGIYGPAVPMTDKQNGAKNIKAVNCIRELRVYGTVSWGARTLEGDDERGSEWKYVPVRRTALFIEESLYRGLQWAVFEPNDEPLWAQLRLNVGAFMNDLFRQGAFQGRSPREAYFVKCDKDTTTQNDINRGVVNVIVGFAPLKPAEFVVIKLTQIAGQIAT